MNAGNGKYAWTAKIGEKGQFVIPKEARELFDLKPGDTILILGDLERGLAIPTRDSMSELSEKIFGR